MSDETRPGGSGGSPPPARQPRARAGAFPPSDDYSPITGTGDSPALNAAGSGARQLSSARFIKAVTSPIASNCRNVIHAKHGEMGRPGGGTDGDSAPVPSKRREAGQRRCYWERRKRHMRRKCTQTDRSLSRHPANHLPYSDRFKLRPQIGKPFDKTKIPSANRMAHENALLLSTTDKN
ncbi:hypothetical protein NDU88_001480 [Pleurodeles waltl]|uniref:Uncharacterized protein n=1 Tax=Pleurodeles waltl TaxID=8319 RepID=A0AAV7LYR4_PLEWA|nr:hypothetical protein NDU88_001480 [Pleurodeles waltl]